LYKIEKLGKVNAGRGAKLNMEGEIEIESILVGWEGNELVYSSFASSKYFISANLLHLKVSSK
jgi:isoaspartyl peptidase/L-asparaginase-like protein (Ntn-hydrolase superfamily)